MPFLAALLTAAALAAGPPPIRVGVLSLLEPTRVEVRGPVRATLPGGAALDAPSGLVVEVSGRGVALSGPATPRREAAWVRAESAAGRVDLVVEGRERIARPVDGPVTVASDGRRLRVVAHVELERLVESAVAAELENVGEAAALEAAAVAVRSYVVASRGRHAAEGFDVCDTTHCVVSKGAPPGVVPGYYTACCGGRTATPDEVWGGRPAGAYRAVSCESCAASPFFRWRRTARVDLLHEALEPLLGWRPGPDADIRAERGAGGWVRAVTVRSRRRSGRVSGEAFRMAVGRRLGWDALPSARFAVERRGAAYALSGGGFGHGVGLCLAGAVERARRGAARGEILAAYYPGAHVGSLP